MRKFLKSILATSSVGLYKGLSIVNLPVELAKLKAMGWITSLRKGDTGIGKTIETLLGIPENNLGEPDCLYNGLEVEVKAHRSNSNSMVTLFTLEAGTRRLNDVQLMKKYGYIDRNGRQALKVTLTTLNFTPQGLMLITNHDRGTISIIDKQGNELWFWSKYDIHLKLRNLCLVSARSRKTGGKEEFYVESAELLTGLNDDRFYDLIDRGIVKIDLRMHIKESGAPRNHGTGFRVLNWSDIQNCYEEVKQIL